MNIDKSDYLIGLTPRMQKEDPRAICALVNRALDGDPGDTDNIELLMETISNFMEERNSVHGFAPIRPGAAPVLLLVKPALQQVLVVNRGELANPAVMAAVQAFGFDGETLIPLEQES